MSPFKARIIYFEIKSLQSECVKDTNEYYGVINVIQSSSKVIPVQGSTPQMTSMVLHSRYAYYNTTLIKVTPTTYFLQLLLLHLVTIFMPISIIMRCITTDAKR